MKKIGEIKGTTVTTSPYVDRDSIYLLHPDNISIAAKITGFKPYTFWDKVNCYFKNLWKALRGKA